MKRIWIISVLHIAAFFVPLQIFGQGQPHHLSAAEKQLLPIYLESLQANRSQATQPPSSPIRTPAEWEEIDVLMVAWKSYPTILSEIIRYAREEAHVIVVCSDSNSVKTTLTSNSVQLSNISYLQTSTNSVWIRDYGPWSVYTNEVDSLLIIDWIYNRPRPLDDQVPIAIAGMLNLPIHQMTTPPYDLVNTGGNFMTDGFGTGFSSKLVLDENWNGTYNLTNKTDAQIDTLMKLFMGLNKYIKMNTLPYDAIHHIDMHMKLLDEETLLVGEYPQGIADGPQIEANLQYVLSNFNSVYGTPYKVIRIPMPPDGNGKYPHQGGDYRTYANAVFVNKTVLVPVYALQYDTTALRIWHEALPGYRIIGINANAMISALGAIHCVTKAVNSNDPLLISHKPLDDTWDNLNPYTVDAKIMHRSGIQNATLYYTSDTTLSYQQANMTLTNASANLWTGTIPAQAQGAEVFYYIKAESVTNKIQVRPLPAPKAYWHFKVLQPSGLAIMPDIIIKDPYPNPTNDMLYIPLEVEKQVLCDISLQSINGGIIEQVYNGTLSQGMHQLVMNTNKLSKGIYLLQILSPENNYIKKVLVR